MDFIFDDDMDEVGSDIEAYCPKCKTDTSHTVITKYEDEIRRVQCSPCGDVHTFRKPRGEVEDDIPEPVAAKKRAALKKPTWREALDRAGAKAVAAARPYSIRDTYDEGDLVSHPKFGVGFVTEISENKVEVTFEDERRVLVHNRPDLAAQMPAIAQMPAPRDERKGKGKRGKGGKAPKAAPPPVAAASPPPVAAKGKPVAAPARPAAKPAPAARPVSQAKVGKAERAKAAAAKKHAAKGARPAVRPTKKPAARAPKASRPAARPARPRPAAKVKKVKAKARAKR